MVTKSHVTLNQSLLLHFIIFFLLGGLTVLIVGAVQVNVELCYAVSVTRLGDLLNFGSVFKAFGNN